MMRRVGAEKLNAGSRGGGGLVTNKWAIFSLVAVGVFMSTLDSSIVNIALPVIMSDFSVPLITIEWVVIIYLLTVSSLLLSFGRLSDIKGRRWVYSRGILIFSMGSLLCGIASGALWLIVSRAFQGIGAAMIMACSPALVVDIFPPNERGKAIGMIGTIVAAGLTTGPALGGFLLDQFSWRSIFYINVPIGVVTGLIAFRLLRGGKADIVRVEPFDFTGAFMLILCFCTFLFALTHAYDWGLLSVRCLSMFAGSLLSAVLFFRMERRTDHPIFDPLVLKVRLFAMPILAGAIMFAALFTIVFLMPFYLIHPGGFPVDQAGYMMVIPFVVLFIVSPISGTISDRIGSRLLCTLGMMILTVSLVSLSRIGPNTPVLSIAWRLILAGIGTSVFLPPNSSAAMSALPANCRGIASGTVATARNVGMVIGVALAGLVFNSVFRYLSGGLTLTVYGPELEPFFMSAFKFAMLAGSSVAGLGVIVAFLRGSDNRQVKTR